MGRARDLLTPKKLIRRDVVLDFDDLIAPDEWEKWFNENCVNCPDYHRCWPDEPRE